jgi:hypothetical protein
VLSPIIQRSSSLSLLSLKVLKESPPERTKQNHGGMRCPVFGFAGIFAASSEWNVRNIAADCRLQPADIETACDQGGFTIKNSPLSTQRNFKIQ